MARSQPSAFKLGSAIAAPPGHWHERATGFAQLAALTIRLPMRSNIGLRLLNGGALGSMTGLLLLLNWWDNLHLTFSPFGSRISYTHHTSLRNYALAFLAMGIWQRRLRLAEEKRGTEPHNFWHGDSWFAFLPLPQKYIDIAIDPLVAFLAGALLRYRLGFHLLGLWVMVAAVAFFITELKLYHQAREDYRDRRDMAKEAQWDANMMTPGGRPQEPRQAPTDGIPTGSAGTGLEAEIARRKREMNVTKEGGE